MMEASNVSRKTTRKTGTLFRSQHPAHLESETSLGKDCLSNTGEARL